MGRLRWQCLLRQAIGLTTPGDPLFDRLARALAGRYTLVRELGRGGMATVYLGTDVKLGRGVAIKLLAPATRAYLGSDRFQREVLLAAQLSHPHIVPLFEADEADGLLFYVMEYVEGESLRQRLSRHGPLSVDDAVRIATEVGDALQYAHENGVIHRDIKPENILLSRGHALVTDFGIAKLMEERGSAEGPALTGAGIAVGTAAYMSPEQASGDKRIDPRSDVYALAAVLYEMLAGEPPFTGPSAQAIAARVINDPPRPIRTVRPALPVHLVPGGGRGPRGRRRRRGRPFARFDCGPARRVFHRFRGGRRGRLPAIPGRHTSPPALDPPATRSMAGDRRTMVGGRCLLRLAAARWPPADRR